MQKCLEKYENEDGVQNNKSRGMCLKEKTTKLNVSIDIRLKYFKNTKFRSCSTLFNVCKYLFLFHVSFE